MMIPLSKWPEYGDKFLELRSLGVSYRLIASQIPVSVTTLKVWGKKFNADITRLSLGRAAAFAEAHLVEIRNRLELRGEQIQRMRAELCSRDFSDMDTGTLLRHYVKYVDSVQKDVDPVRVEVSSTLQNYEQIMLRCAQVEPDESE